MPEVHRGPQGTSAVERRTRVLQRSLGPYRFIASTNGYWVDRLKLGLTIHAGAYAQSETKGFEWNEVEAEYHPEHAAFHDPKLRLAVVTALVEAMEPRWACAAQYAGENERGGLAYTPWVIWTMPGDEAPGWCGQSAGPPAETHPLFGGELHIWPGLAPDAPTAVAAV